MQFSTWAVLLGAECQISEQSAVGDLPLSASKMCFHQHLEKTSLSVGDIPCGAMLYYAVVQLCS